MSTKTEARWDRTEGCCMVGAFNRVRRWEHGRMSQIDPIPTDPLDEFAQDIRGAAAEREAMTAFILARYDELEAAAKWAGAGVWYDTPPLRQKFADGGFNEADTSHILRHDPAHVLADLEAKRWLVEHAGSLAWVGDGSAAWQVLAAFARPFAAHEDYSEDWRP